MSYEELDYLIVRIRTDDELRMKLSSAKSLFHAAEISQRAGFKVTWQDWLRHQARQALLLDEAQIADYCQKVSAGKEIFPHATFMPVFGYLCQQDSFYWVSPFESESSST